jgi:hypothetical protein
MASPVFVNSKELIALASDSPLFELARVLVRLNHLASVIRKRELQRDVNGCENWTRKFGHSNRVIRRD